MKRGRHYCNVYETIPRIASSHANNYCVLTVSSLVPISCFRGHCSWPLHNCFYGILLWWGTNVYFLASYCDWGCTAIGVPQVAIDKSFTAMEATSIIHTCYCGTEYDIPPSLIKVQHSGGHYVFPPATDQRQSYGISPSRFTFVCGHHPRGDCRDARPDVANSFAMEAASNMHTCYYRAGYDISMPLVPKNVFHELEGIAPLDREFFLTVKVRYFVFISGLLPNDPQ